MSRSNPNDHLANPSTRWFKWNGEHGTVCYYDKDKKEEITVGSDFGFVLLDQLGCVRGWHDASTSGIYSNEVRDTRADVLVVKAFKGGTLAEGLYKSIKHEVNAAGGSFVANCYIAYKRDGQMAIGAIGFKGAALKSWMEFTKANRAQLYKQAIQITGFEEGKKGRVIFRVPKFQLKELSAASNDEAVKLDVQLQDYMTAYLKRTKKDQIDTVETEPHHMTDEEVAGLQPPAMDVDEDSIPF